MPGSSRSKRDVLTVLIGLLWRGWGTPSGEYSSGFEEEYELAKKQRAEGKTEETWLFFKEVPEDMLANPGDQLRNLPGSDSGVAQAVDPAWAELRER
jgi:hypothetical protein